MNILVTGGAGFIGSNFVRYCRERRPTDRIVVLDALTYAGNVKSLAPHVKLIHGNICDDSLVSRVLHGYQIDVIVHFAAESHVDRSIDDPQVFLRTNVMGTATLLERARQAHIKQFIHVSTDEVYGDLPAFGAGFTESTPIAPRSPYAASKAASDMLALAWHETYGFPVIITRCSNNYGPYQHPEKFIPKMILNALHDRPLPVYGQGANVRDWIHVEDHCAAIARVLEKGEYGEVYNIGARSERSNLEVAKAILKITEKPNHLLCFVKDRPGHDFRYAVNPSRIEKALGWQCSPRSFEERLRDTINWYRENRDWWQRSYIP